MRPMTHSLPQQPSRPVAMATAKPVVKSTSKYMSSLCVNKNNKDFYCKNFQQICMFQFQLLIPLLWATSLQLWQCPHQYLITHLQSRNIIQTPDQYHHQWECPCQPIPSWIDQKT